MTKEQVQDLAAQIVGAKMRRMTYELGGFLLEAFENDVHKVAGYANFTDWYINELNELSCPRTLWDTLKVERVRRALNIPLSSLKNIDVSKAKKIAQLCDPDGRVKRGHDAMALVGLFDLARTATLEEISSQVETMKANRVVPRYVVPSR